MATTPDRHDAYDSAEDNYGYDQTTAVRLDAWNPNYLTPGHPALIDITVNIERAARTGGVVLTLPGLDGTTMILTADGPHR